MVHKAYVKLGSIDSSEWILGNLRASIAGEIVVNSEAAENLSTLCDRYGSRFFATQEEKDAAEFLSTKLREYRLRNVRVEPYIKYGWNKGELVELWSWKRETARLELLKPVAKGLSCISFANAPSTSNVGVTAEIYNLESGSRAYVLGHREDIRGKLILDDTYTRLGSYLDTTRGRDPMDLDPSTLYGYLEQFGAAGLLYSNRNYGALPITGTARYGLIGKIPACGISREASQFIVRQMCKETVVANLKVQNTYASGARSYNVIADLPGRVNPEEIILVGGHYDGLDISVGAMDDAAGACVVLESARALAKYGPFKRTIRFCCLLVRKSA